MQLPSLQSISKRKTPEPSTKNGRRSGKERFKGAEIDDRRVGFYLPKSGLTVAVSVSAGVIAYFMSRPTDAPGFTPLMSGLPSSGWVDRSPTV